MPFVFLLAAAIASDPAIFSGRERQLDVRPPRIEADATIDGRLDEPAWQNAAVLTGFSRYAPNDGVPADDSTHVLVWYSPTAIHFGIRAFAEPGTVHATLADRDRIFSDDYIGIFLGTFNDGRQAMAFAVNPLGVQGDGIVVERGAQSSGGFSGFQSGREPTDLSPDYVYQSKGRVTEYGYEVEIRIPFKSLRYQPAAKQTWGINVIRIAQSRGTEYSWVPAQRAAASYLGQSGHLMDLTELHRGLVLDLNPVVTQRVTGGRIGPTGTGYDYDAQSAQYGGNVRWGITNNLTLNGTVNPDFAEVESDAGQLIIDPRLALQFPEKRPFFLDGIEQFAVPSQLIYTRRIADPITAAKLTGKHDVNSFAFLSAVDDRDVSATGDRTFYNLLRVQRDLGRSSRAGLVYTDRVEGEGSNRVLGADGRFVWNKIYSAQWQAAVSRTEAPGADVRAGPLYSVDLRRSGRAFAARWMASAMHDEFETQSGFISRPAVARVLLDHSYTAYGREGALVRSATLDVSADGLWQYERFVHGDDMLEKKLHINSNYRLAGGWTAGASFLLETFGFDDSFYSPYYVAHRVGTRVDTIPFQGLPRITNRDYLVQVNTPNFRKISASLFYLWGRDENFFEWAPASIGWVQSSLDWRPTEQMRVSGTYNWQWYNRPSDGSQVGATRIPRLKLEYQITRAIFVRAIGEYRADYADDLRDAAHTNDPILVCGAAGTCVQGRGFSTVTRRPKEVNRVRPELLFSYLPSPGTVVFAGYGSTLSEVDALHFDKLQKVQDALFVKLSYLFRM
jgi:uncharacterized protein DUF5916